MAKDTKGNKSGPVQRAAGKGGHKGGAPPPRRRVVRLSNKPLTQRLADVAASPTLFWGVVAIAAFTLVVGSVASWTRGRPLIAVDQVMSETRSARVEFNTEDKQQTQMLREAARQNVPRIYNADLPVLEEIRASLLNLPRTIAGVAALDEVDERIRVRFGITPESFGALREIGRDDALRDSGATASRRSTRSCAGVPCSRVRAGSVRRSRG